MTNCPDCAKWRIMSALICVGLLAMAISNAVFFHRWQAEIDAAAKSSLAPPPNPASERGEPSRAGERGSKKTPARD